MGWDAVVPYFDGAVFSCGDEDIAGGPCDGGGGAEGGGGGGVSWEGGDGAQGGFVEEVEGVGWWRGGECVEVGEGGGGEDVDVCREGCGGEGRDGEVEEVVCLDESGIGHGICYVIRYVGVRIPFFFFFSISISTICVRPRPRPVRFASTDHHTRFILFFGSAVTLWLDNVRVASMGGEKIRILP